jgi:hypothetical protein
MSILKRLLLSGAAIFFVLLQTSCNGNSVSKKTNPKDSSVAIRKYPNIQVTVDRQFNDAARYIAGLPAESGSDFAQFENEKWKKYAGEFDAEWHTYDTSRVNPILPWRKSELPDYKGENETLFYPFSGPDFLYASTFFPNAATTVMVGLEPTGKLPSTIDFKNDSSVTIYLNEINTALSAFLDYSFFITKHMSVDLHKQELNGVAHMIALFMARTNHRILNIQHVTLDANGNVTDWNPNWTWHDNDGLRIYYTGEDSNFVQTLYYFSTNIGNGVLRKNLAMQKFLTGLPDFDTYIKSASYLLYDTTTFSILKSIIFKKSYRILQDDSGFPYSELKKDYNVQLYGHYDLIPIFKYRSQKDFQTDYQNPKLVKPLPFGIGYMYYKNRSNMQIATRKS